MEPCSVYCSTICPFHSLGCLTDFSMSVHSSTTFVLISGTQLYNIEQGLFANGHLISFLLSSLLFFIARINILISVSFRQRWMFFWGTPCKKRIYWSILHLNRYCQPGSYPCPLGSLIYTGQLLSYMCANNWYNQIVSNIDLVAKKDNTSYMIFISVCEWAEWTQGPVLCYNPALSLSFNLT